MQGNRTVSGRSVDTWITELTRSVTRDLNQSTPDIMRERQRQFERAIYTAALAHTGGRKAEAALLLGVGRNTLTRKLQALQIRF